MNESFEEFLQARLFPLFINVYGFKKNGIAALKKTGENICVLITFEAARFNYSGRYGFNILLHVIGLKAGAKTTGSLAALIKNGNTLIATVNIKEVINKPPTPYILKNDNEELLVNEIGADVSNPALSQWLKIGTVQDIENIVMLPANSRFIYNIAVYFAVTGQTEKSRGYFLLIKNGNDVVAKAAASLGIDLN